MSYSTRSGRSSAKSFRSTGVIARASSRKTSWTATGSSGHPAGSPSSGSAVSYGTCVAPVDATVSAKDGALT